MLTILSPSKTQDFTQPFPKGISSTVPSLLENTEKLADVLRAYPANKLARLMDISDKLAELNAGRFRDFSTPFTPKNARPALFAFKGDVYSGIEVEDYSAEDMAFAVKHLRILSGFYGLLGPLDLIQPYRLEMKIKLKTPRGRDLYQFWGTRITECLNGALNASGSDILVNLASEEYFKAVRADTLRGRVVTPVFKEKSKDSLKVVGLFAKQARGHMANWIIRERIDTPKALKDFTKQGYSFAPELSDDATLTFVREQPKK